MTPELLMPAGNLEKLKYAFAYGADAVYAGAPQLSLRARENQFKYDQIAEGVEYAHALGKKFYLTTNIVAHNRKIVTFENKLDGMMQVLPDALIMADPGLLAMAKEKYPDVEMHLSVQANAMNWATAKFWYKNGVSRIILSRELSMDEIKEIKDNAPEMELEVFVHGAICIAHSGRCLLSNYFNYRDANDGCCTNACRWNYNVYTDQTATKNPATEEYKPIQGDYFIEESERPGQLMRIDEDEHGTYIMNAKDLMAIDYIKDLKDAGVDSFKIEGRTKSIYYLAMVTRAYRNAIDDVIAGREFNDDNKKDLYKIHNRGYTAGFLINRADESIQRYEQGITDLYNQEFAAIVLKVEKGRALITPRNKLCVGDRIEFITPDATHVTLVESMIDEEGESHEAIHGGTNVQVWVPIDFELPNEFVLVSKVVSEEEAKPTIIDAANLPVDLSKAS